jgi:hypothetical protein
MGSPYQYARLDATQWGDMFNIEHSALLAKSGNQTLYVSHFPTRAAKPEFTFASGKL